MRRFAAAAILALTAAPLHAVELPQPKAMSGPVFGGSVAVEASGHIQFDVGVPDGITSPKLVGHLLASGGTGNDIVVLVLTQTEYVNWKNNHTAHTLYNSGQVTAAELDVNLPRAGIYHLILSNDFSAFTPKTVTGELEVRWIQMPTSAEIANAQAANQAEREALETKQIGIFSIFGVAVAGGTVWLVSSRRRKKAVSTA